MLCILVRDSHACCAGMALCIKLRCVCCMGLSAAVNTTVYALSWGRHAVLQ